VGNTTDTLRVLMPSVLAMLTLVTLGAALGWIGGALVARLARAGDLDRRSREWGLTQGLARAGVYTAPAQLLRLVVFWGVFVLFGGLVLALALAFGLGGRHLARHILERGRLREREPSDRETISHI